ncbi:hypothetical protein M9H77_23253 [Catharanthus roseus]|uniref:Uncharacterized protein n=1 Tax=Catharanthus roseus TaxID=4058 RepID=A0ACC0AUB5_CATRO|nr:hypothetical protein M9H77_23253 [Catharanthus roseus]
MPLGVEMLLFTLRLYRYPYDDLLCKQSGCFIMSTEGQLPTKSHQEGTSDPTRMNLNETLRVGYQGSPQASGGRREGQSGRGYYREHEDVVRHEARREDNLFEDVGEDSHVNQAYNGNQ